MDEKCGHILSVDDLIASVMKEIQFQDEIMQRISNNLPIDELTKKQASANLKHRRVLNGVLVQRALQSAMNYNSRIQGRSEGLL